MRDIFTQSSEPRRSRLFMFIALLCVLGAVGFGMYMGRPDRTVTAKPAAGWRDSPNLIAGMPFKQVDNETKAIGLSTTLSPQQKFDAFWNSYQHNKTDVDAAMYYLDSIRGLELHRLPGVGAMLLRDVRDNAIPAAVRADVLRLLGDLYQPGNGPREGSTLNPDIRAAVVDSLNSGVPELSREGTLEYSRLDMGSDIVQVLTKARSAGIISGDEFATAAVFSLPHAQRGQAQIAVLQALSNSGASPGVMSSVIPGVIVPMVQAGQLDPAAQDFARQLMGQYVPTFPQDNAGFSSTTALSYADAAYALAQMQANATQTPAQVLAHSLVNATDPRDAIAVLISPQGSEVAQALATSGDLDQVKQQILNYQASQASEPYVQEVTTQSIGVLARASH
jgi:hypothetical protein